MAEMVAFLVLVLIIMPQMVASIKFPRLPVNPKAKQQFQQYARDHGSDWADFFRGVRSNNDKIQPSNGVPRNHGRSQAPATDTGGYVFNFTVGSEDPQPLSGVIDITSDLVWVQCDDPRTSTTQQGQGAVFYPTKSSTMVAELCTGSICQSFVRQTCSTDTPNEQCLYIYKYNGGQANTTGYLANDTFTFASDPVNVTFGCGFYNNVGDLGGASGVIGLGRAPLSLVSQLQAGRFSYYFAPDDGTQSFISFGEDATPNNPRPLSTSLNSSDAYPSFYYAGLTDIQVDGHVLGIPSGTFDLQADGSGGVILSTTIPVTFLDERAYNLLTDKLKSKIGLQTADGSALGLDLCYTSQSLATTNKIPAMALVFDGNAVMELETWNYFYMDAATGLECLSILPYKARGGSLLGNLIQMGTHMIYDIDGKKLQFESFQQQASPPPSDLSSQGSPPFAPTLRILSLVYYMLLYWSTAF